MKILMVTPEYYPYGIGGGSEVYKQLAERYVKKGHVVTVVYGFYPVHSWSEKIKIFKKKNITFYLIPLIPYPKQLPLLKTRFPCNFSSYKQLSKIIAKEKPDVAHLHGTGFMFIDIMAKKLFKQKVPYIITNHGNPGKIFKSNFIIKFLWNTYTTLFLNPTLQHARRITFVSNYIKNDPINMYPEKSITIYNGIDPAWHIIQKNTVNIRKKYSILPKEKVILTVGRISEMKGIREMIETLPLLIKNGLSIKYLIMGHIGDITYKKSLNELIKRLNLEKNVLFVGFLPEEEKKQYYQQADIIAIPSLWEGFGLVVLEAMSFNKVILSNKKGSLPEVHNHYKKIVYLSDKNIVRSIHEKLKERSKFNFDRFDWDRISNDYLDLLTETAHAVK